LPYFARLNADGSIDMASPTVIRDPELTGRFTTTSTGHYQVDFGFRIGDCVPVATYDNNVGGSTFGYVTAGIESSVQVTVRTFRADGTPVDAPFDVILAC
jgi:hypothetical protein